MESDSDKRERRLAVPLAIAFVVLAGGASAVVGACGDDVGTGGSGGAGGGTGGDIAEGAGGTGGTGGIGGAPEGGSPSEGGFIA